MNWLDLFIAIFLVTAVIRGLEVGFIRQFCSTAGFFAGLFLGALVEGKVIGHVHSPEAKVVVTLAVVGIVTSLLWGIGEYVGLRLKFIIGDGSIGDKLDKIFGSLLAVVTLLAAIWLGTAVLRNLPDGVLQRQVRSSHVVAFLERELPQAPNVITKLGHLIDPNGFPQVFAGLEPSIKTDAPLPDMGELNGAVGQARPSVVKIEGTGCGGVIEGSGFVAGTDEVVTNAHVVAGVARPFVADQAGAHRATVVSFDPDLDIAILHVSGLVGKPLNLNGQTAPGGTPAAVLGYPGDGGFTAGPAAVLESFIATGRNIYNQGRTNRTIYSLKADVEQGNSGGPLIAKDGSVIGVIFAKSTTYHTVGYALTMPPVIQEITQAAGNTGAVSTGSCAE